jgi:DNA-binding response OmpR family regulator
MRALIADDDRVTASILNSTLERWGLEVSVAHDGYGAWEQIRAGGIGLAILDWEMPRVSGLDVCRRVRADGSHAGLYIILLTSRDTRADLVAGLDAGANDYLTKPFDPEELRARVYVGLRVANLQQRLADRVAELQEALTKVKRLSGLLPICSYCKSIRSDTDYWEQVEQYMAEHTDVKFSHGICPSCYEKVNAEIESDPRWRK